MNHYDEAVALTRILAIAVERLGGRLEVPGSALYGDPEYVITSQEDFLRDLTVIKVRKIQKELGEVLDVSGLKEAVFDDDEMGEGLTRRYWHAEANGEVASIETSDLSAKFYVSPILTMRTIGVALVDDSGSMVAHTTRSR